MAALAVRWLAVPVACMAFAEPVATQTDPASSGSSPLDVPAQLAAVEQLAAEAEFEQALDALRKLITSLEPPAGQPPPTGQTRAWLVKAYEVEAACHKGLGSDKQVRQAIERVLTLSPGHQVDPAGPGGTKLAAQFENVRKTLIGKLELTCTPLPCDRVVVDGELLAPAADGGYLVLAGGRRIEAGRRNFESRQFPELFVDAGKTTPLAVTLEQVSRDLVIVTEPAEVTVVIDDVERGKTEPGEGSSSRPFLVEQLEPGSHVVVLSAPCRRRLEQLFEIELDAQDPSPRELGTLRLASSQGVLSLAPSQPLGELLVDGEPAAPGSREVCPGPHEISWVVAQRRVWFQAVEVRDGETLNIAPTPRPTLAYHTDKPLPGLPSSEHNAIALNSDAAAALWSAIEAPRQASGSAWPERFLTRAVPATDFKRWAPEADLVLLTRQTTTATRTERELVLIAPALGLIEEVRWPAEDAAATARWLQRARAGWPSAEYQLGVDLIPLADGSQLAANVVPGAAAATAGIENGDRLSGALPSRWDGTPITLQRERDGARQELTLTPSLWVYAPLPAAFPDSARLAHWARTTVWSVVGSPAETMAAPAQAGLILYSFGRVSDAVAALDRVAIDQALDPAGDARASAAWVQESLLRAAARDEFADEVQQRWTKFPLARLGGRRGPPLRHAVSQLNSR